MNIGSRSRLPASERARSGAARVTAVILGAACLAVAAAASAAQADAGALPPRQIPLEQVITILFMMLGPFKIIGPFMKATEGADPRMARRIALWATVFSAIALLIAGLLGEFFLSRYGVPPAVLALAGGLIFFLVALKNVLEQFEATEAPSGAPVAAPASVFKAALAPLAFPTIVTPYGIAAVIVMITFSQSLDSRLGIGAVVVGIMLVNLIFMLAARHLLPGLGLILRILGAVLGVVQVALGLQIINNALRLMGVL